MNLLRQPAVIVSWIITVIAVAAAITFWAQGANTRSDLSAELQEAIAAREAVVGELTTVRTRVDDLEAAELRLAEVTTAVENVGADETAAQERVAALTAEASELEARVAELTQSRATAEEEEAAAAERLAAAQERLASLEADREQLAATVEDLSSQSETLASSVATAQATLAGRQDEAETMSDQLAGIRSEVEALTATRSELQGQIETLTADAQTLAAAQEDVAAAEQRQSELTAELADARDSLGAAAEAEERETALRQDIETLTADRDRLRAENESLAAADEEASVELEREIAALQETRARLTEAVDALEERTAALDEAAEALRSSSAAIDDALDAFEPGEATDGAVASTSGLVAAVPEAPAETETASPVDGSTPEAAPLSGTYTSERVTATFDDGAFSLAVEGGPTVDGAYALEGDVLRLSGVEGPAAGTFPLACQLGQAGDTITLSAYRGSCLPLHGITLTRQ